MDDFLFIQLTHHDNKFMKLLQDILYNKIRKNITKSSLNTQGN